jgi:hypothetical protein
MVATPECGGPKSAIGNPDVTEMAAMEGRKFQGVMDNINPKPDGVASDVPLGCRHFRRTKPRTIVHSGFRPTMTQESELVFAWKRKRRTMAIHKTGFRPFKAKNIWLKCEHI